MLCNMRQSIAGILAEHMTGDQQELLQWTEDGKTGKEDNIEVGLS